jgi:hypothetical protein
MLLHYCCFIRFFPTLVFPCDTIGCDPAGCPHTAPHDKNKRLLLYRSWNCSSVPDTSPLLSEWAATNPEKIVNYSIVLAASTLTSTKQPRIRLTKTFSKNSASDGDLTSLLSP